MFQQIDTWLQSPDPDDRMQALRTLIKNDMSETLVRRVLAIYLSDREPEVQHMAMAALKRLGQKSLAEATSFNSSWRLEAPRMGGKAEQLLREAGDAVLIREYGEALAFARAAYALDPTMIHDESKLKRLAMAFRTSPSRTLVALGVAPNALGAAQPTHHHDAEAETETAWQTDLRALLVSALVYGGTVALGGLILLVVIVVVDGSPHLRSASTLATALIGSLLAAGSAALGWLLFNLMAHFVATRLGPGKNSLAALLRYVTWPAVLSTLIVYGLYMVIVVLNPVIVRDLNFDPVTDSGLLVPSTFSLLFAIQSFDGLLLLFYGWALGRVYGFGIGTGCMAILVTAVVAGMGTALLGGVFLGVSS